MFFSALGFVVTLYTLYRLLRFAIILALDTFYGAEERMAGRRFVERVDDPELNRLVADALASFTEGRQYLWAGAAAAMAAIAAVPLIHLLYALWVRFIMLFTDPMRFGNRVLHASLEQIAGYLPRIAINMVALALVGAFYAGKRRKYQQEDRLTRILFWRVQSVEVFGTVLGWALYLVVAVLPRVTARGWFTFLGMLTLGGGWVWVFSGVLVSMYLRTGQNALLWVLFRYRWRQAMPAVVRMMAVRRLALPASVIKEVTVDEAAGAVQISAEVDAIDAERLSDSLLALPGLRRPEVVPLGPPPGYPVRIATELAPRMRPLPPRSFRRPEGPPKGYGAETNPLDPLQGKPTTPGAANNSAPGNTTKH